MDEDKPKLARDEALELLTDEQRSQVESDDTVSIIETPIYAIVVGGKRVINFVQASDEEDNPLDGTSVSMPGYREGRFASVSAAAEYGVKLVAAALRDLAAPDTDF